MATPQTKRLIIARLAGFDAPLHKVSAANWKRLSDAVRVVRGDGTSRVDKLHDPAVTVEPITLELVVEKNEAFIAKARALFLQHKQDPSSAGPLVIVSMLDNGTVLDQVTLVRAVIQGVTAPEGDTLTHGEAMAQIVVDPEDVIG